MSRGNKFTTGSNNGNEAKVEFKKYKLVTPAIKGGESGANILMTSFPESEYGEAKLEAWKKVIEAVNKKFKKTVLSLEEVQNVDYDKVDIEVEI